MSQQTIVIIGAGQGGFQTAASLREMRYAGRIVLVGDERQMPYQRPPLSKAYLLDECSESQLAVRPDAFYAQRGIELLLGKRAVAIDRLRRKVVLDDDSVLEYDHLVLATGARNRLLPVPGANLKNVFYLRTLDEAHALQAATKSSRTTIVIGAGFIGLEFAASAAKQGATVTVLDIADRPMARALSRTMSSVFAREHASMGVNLMLNEQVVRLRGADGAVTGVETVGGKILPADLVFIGIGVIPNVELAAACGLTIENGILVDEYLVTSDSHISAIGDVAAHPNPYAGNQRMRLESVQNACDQGRCVAARLVGGRESYHSLPWFWSNQGRLKLQIAGVQTGDCREVLRGDLNSTGCTLFIFKGERLVCVETLNRPSDHMLARRLLETHAGLTPQQAADMNFDLKSALPAAAGVVAG